MTRVLLVLVAAGLLGGCGEAQLKQFSPASAPTPDDSFKTGVTGVTVIKCSETSCHTVPNPAGNLLLDPTKASCEQLYRMLVDTGGNMQRSGSGLDVDVANPTDSLLLTKPDFTSIPSHGGGQVLQDSSSEYQTLLHWIEAGAPDDCSG